MKELFTFDVAPEFAADARLRVLIVEDEPTQRLVLTRNLTRAGYAVEACQNGLEALQQLQRADFAMVVTDWDMPGMSGTELCREIRRTEAGAYLYIVMLTRHEQPDDLVGGMQAGADNYVRKSEASTELIARLAAGARIVRLARSLREAQARIELLSVTDPLLPLFNRRYLNEQLAREIERSRRYARSLSVIMADLDHFKRINDQHGHAAGDDVLRAVATLLNRALRPGDWAARYGGEEFLVALPETSSTTAQELAEQLRLSLASETLEHAGAPLVITASFGVATLLLDATRQGADALRELLQRADAALYRAKAEGRNRVSVAG
jgi:two-component system chemotaxis response regulator CheY